MAEQLERLRDGLVERDSGQAPVAGGVRGVDQGAEALRDLAGPDGIRVALGGVLNIPEDVRQHSWWTMPATES